MLKESAMHGHGPSLRPMQARGSTGSSALGVAPLFQLHSLFGYFFLHLFISRRTTRSHHARAVSSRGFPGLSLNAPCLCWLIPSVFMGSGQCSRPLCPIRARLQAEQGGVGEVAVTRASGTWHSGYHDSSLATFGWNSGFFCSLMPRSLFSFLIAPARTRACLQGGKCPASRSDLMLPCVCSEFVFKAFFFFPPLSPRENPRSQPRASSC